jgi:hypothetical protein
LNPERLVAFGAAIRAWRRGLTVVLVETLGILAMFMAFWVGVTDLVRKL